MHCHKTTMVTQCKGRNLARLLIGLREIFISKSVQSFGLMQFGQTSGCFKWIVFEVDLVSLVYCGFHSKS